MNCFHKYIEWAGGPLKAAERLGRHWSGIYPILQGKRGCSAPLALLIEKDSRGRFRAARLIEETALARVKQRQGPARKRRK